MIEKGLELDLGIAQHVRIGGAAGLVFVQEIRKHAILVFGSEIDSLDVTFKAVTLASVSASANSELAFAVRNELRSDPMFDPDETDFCPGCTLTADEPPGVFTFRMTVKLKKPLRL